MKELQKILKQLNLWGQEGLYSFQERDKYSKDELSFRTILSLNKIQPDYFFCKNKIPVILFFDLTDNTKRSSVELHKLIWNFNQAPIVIIVYNNEIKIYNGFVFDTKKSLLHELCNSDRLNEFNFNNLIIDNTWRSFENSFKDETRVDYKLLKNIGATRELLISSLSDIEETSKEEIINNLIGRLIFIRYLIDRNVNVDNEFIAGNTSKEKNENFLQLFSDKDKLYNFFKYLKSKFHGDLFPLDSVEENLIKAEHLQLLFHLFNGDEIRGKSIQLSLFNFYDFEIIPVEFISNIYENFIGINKRQTNKSYYTPLFLVDQVLTDTVEKHLRESNTVNCKVLDPSCGSGIFLVETLRKIIEKELELTKSSTISEENLKKLVKDNIFGVDADKKAVFITIFSLYITLLDYQKPADIEKFSLPYLLDVNIFVGDFFRQSDTYNRALKQLDTIDFIIGNPPWGIPNQTEYLNYCNTHVPKINIGNKQIAEAFLYRVKDFVFTNTIISLIIPAKSLYNLNSKEFRGQFFNDFTILKITELSSIRHSIFNKSISPATIIQYRFLPNVPTAHQKIEHINIKQSVFFSLFKIMIISKNDIKYFLQSYIQKYDWFLKTILFGSFFDFYFIERLHNEQDSFEKNIIDNKMKVMVGISIGKENRKYKTDFLADYKYLNIRDKGNTDVLNRYFINYNKLENWKPQLVYRNKINHKEIFKSPQVLIKTGVNINSFDVSSSVCTKNVVFTDGVIVIKNNENDLSELYCIAAILNSKLFTYYITMTSSCIGIEREKLLMDEIMKFPIKFSELIAIYSYEMHHLMKLKRSAIMSELQVIEESVYHLSNKIEEEIYRLYNLSDEEKDLIDYNTKISIPTFTTHIENKLVQKSSMEEYCNVFIDYFMKKLDDSENRDYFCAEVYSTNLFVAVNFVNKKKIGEKIERFSFNKETDALSVLKNLGKIGLEKVNSHLIKFREMKGFENDSFFIIKLNDHKYWHKAIARIDLAEIINEIMKSN